MSRPERLIHDTNDYDDDHYQDDEQEYSDEEEYNAYNNNENLDDGYYTCDDPNCYGSDDEQFEKEKNEYKQSQQEEKELQHRHRQHLRHFPTPEEMEEDAVTRALNELLSWTGVKTWLLHPYVAGAMFGIGTHLSKAAFHYLLYRFAGIQMPEDMRTVSSVSTMTLDGREIVWVKDGNVVATQSTSTASVPSSTPSASVPSVSVSVPSSSSSSISPMLETTNTSNSSSSTTIPSSSSSSTSTTSQWRYQPVNQNVGDLLSYPAFRTKTGQGAFQSKST